MCVKKNACSSCTTLVKKKTQNILSDWKVLEFHIPIFLLSSGCSSDVVRREVWAVYFPSYSFLFITQHLPALLATTYYIIQQYTLNYSELHTTILGTKHYFTRHFTLLHFSTLHITFHYFVLHTFAQNTIVISTTKYITWYYTLQYWRYILNDTENKMSLL